jgi:hypothetical protein
MRRPSASERSFDVSVRRNSGLRIGFAMRFNVALHVAAVVRYQCIADVL